MALSSQDFPQADDLDKVLLTVRAVASGKVTDADIETAMGLDSGSRQGRYYRKAGETLGLLTNVSNYARLTTAGLQLAAASSAAETRALLREAILRNEPLALLAQHINEGNSDRSELKRYYRSIYPEKPSTADRRISTALNYLTRAGIAEASPNGHWRPAKDVRRDSVPAASSSEPVDNDGSGYDTSAKAYQLAAGSATESITQSSVRQVDIDLQKLERANHVHAWLVDQTARRLASAGIDSATTSHIDLMASHSGENVIYEMKSISQGAANLISQVRKAVSQLHEYRYFHALDATLCIVTNAPVPPEASWLEDYLPRDRGIAYVWLDEGGEPHSHINSDGLLSDWM